MLWLVSRMQVPWVVLGWVALVPWLGVVDSARSAREAWGPALGLSLCFNAAVFGWFPEAIAAYARAPAWVCWAVFLALSPLLEPQFLVFALARLWMRRAVGEDSRGAWLPPAVAGFAYLGTEWLVPKLFAETLGHGFYASEWLRQGADVAGAPGLTLVLLVVNECVLAAVKGWRAGGARRAVRPVAVALAVGLGCLAYGAVRLRQVRAAVAPGPGLRVGAVQANITHYEKLAAERGTYDVVRMILDTHYALSDALLRSGPVDLLVWPETVYPTTFGVPKSEDGAALDDEIRAFVTRSGVPLVFGTYDLEGEREFNAAMFLGPDGHGGLTRTAYRKTMLFPLTEWVPESVDSPTLREWLPWTGYWKRGPGPRVVALPLREGRVLKVAPLICYESIFPGYVAEEVRQGAELLLTLSNDSWFSGTPAPRLHLMHAAFRSIETRRPQVRVTNSGISALIDPTGAVLAEVEDQQRASLPLSVPTTAPLTSLALAWGDWLGPVALLLSLVLGVGARGYFSRSRMEAMRSSGVSVTM
ncbi:apolipoprotein N-acyltransferase [Corallococcus sp. H22C18031201]|nr:apolipoprotein N-acyltransferase [Corallococcus sp. H22C18031201]